METQARSNTPAADYDPHQALLDATRSELAVAERLRFAPIDHVNAGLIGVSFVLATFNYLFDGWLSYAVGAIPLLAIIAVSFGLLRKLRGLESAGFLGLGTKPGLRAAAGPMGLLIGSMLVYLAALPVRDVFDTGEWIVHVASVVLLVSWVAASLWAGRIVERTIERLTTEVARLEARP